MRVAGSSVVSTPAGAQAWVRSLSIHWALGLCLPAVGYGCGGTTTPQPLGAGGVSGSAGAAVQGGAASSGGSDNGGGKSGDTASSSGSGTGGTSGAAGDGIAGAGGIAGALVGAAGSASSAGSADCMVPPAPPLLVGWAQVAGGGVSTTTGGGDAVPTVVTTLATLNSALGGAQARVIYVRGSISGTVIVGSNKTLVGTCGAQLTGDVHLNNVSNIIIRNLKIVGLNCKDSPSDCSGGEDAITVDGSHHLWFDHLDISDGSDGNLDINSASDFVTVSWSKFHYSSARTDPKAGTSGHRFSNLVGSSDTATSDALHLNVTFHHVWWADHVDQRMPRVRFGKVHVFDSLYTASGNSYCVGVGVSASLRVENNAFVKVLNPVDSIKYIDANSRLTSVGNLYDETIDTATNIGAAFTPPYAYTLEPATGVQASVSSGAGPR